MVEFVKKWLKLKKLKLLIPGQEELLPYDFNYSFWLIVIQLCIYLFESKQLVADFSFYSKFNDRNDVEAVRGLQYLIILVLVVLTFYDID